LHSPPGSPVFRYLCEEQGLTCAQVQVGQVDPARPRGFPTAGFMHLRMHLDHLFSRGLRWVDTEETRPYGHLQSRFHGLSDHVPLVARFELETPLPHPLPSPERALVQVPQPTPVLPPGGVPAEV
jgi:hypothetical protein